MKRECRYCGEEIVKGFFYAHNKFQWFDDNMNFMKKVLGMGEVLSSVPLVKSYRCKGCNKIIVDLNEK